MQSSWSGTGEVALVAQSTVTRQDTRISLLVCAVALAACSHESAPAPEAPPEVAVMTLAAKSVSISTELPGRTVPYRIAEVRPQVNGVILKRLFTEGGQVKAGQQLYLIDPAPFQASLQSAEAALARAQASATSTRLLAQRYKPLSEARAVSQQDYDNAVASQDQAVADVASAKAAVDTAKINLAYTKVLAPISGRTGRSSVTEGALVAVSQTAALVVIQQLDPIYVDATQASKVLLDLRRALAEGRLKQAGESQAEATLILEDGTAYGSTGKLQFTEVTVDAGTGSVTMRAVFPNPDNTLLPGMFVRERLEEGVDEHGLLVPQRALTHNQRGDALVTVVGPDNKANPRIVKTERAIGDQWLIGGGVTAGDKIIMSGIQSVKSGETVHPHELAPGELNDQSPASSALQKQ
jgi:membrane fusion protein, multidrug efflux system